ncbi:MAG: aconitase X catalytic domain-containing protein [Candidatus Micrarchaeota archaeon]
MQLTEKEEKMFNGEMGEANQQSIEILVALGKIYDAKKMIKITNAQIAGVSFKTIGNAGLEYLDDLVKKGAKVTVPTFLNPAGMDVEQWKEMRIPEDFAKKQIQVLESYTKMGIMNTCTCTPYFIGIRPKVGEHVAWAESSAVSFCNSVLGARTNREGGPSALAAAICGVTPEYGLHLDENRVAEYLVEVKCPLNKMTDYGALGNLVGSTVKNKIPAFTGLDKKDANEDRMKSLGASMAASGSVALYYVQGITPEWKISDKPEKITIEEKDIKEAKEKLITGEDADLITIGCPHASIDEIKEVAELVEGKKLKKELWICTARANKKIADTIGLTKKIEDAGGRIVADTCMVVCPIEAIGYKTTGVNSGKAAKYLPGLCKQKVVFKDIEELI